MMIYKCSGNLSRKALSKKLNSRFSFAPTDKL